MNYAIRHNKHHLRDILVKYGATAPPSQKQKAPLKQKAQVPVQPRQKVNERLVPKEYVLQILDNG